jgi:hypothetical protein
MKRFYIQLTIGIAAFIILISVIYCCFPNHSPDHPRFLPGIYVSACENEFCKILDTLTIRRASPGGYMYTITRRYSFLRIKDGRIMPPEDEQDQWQATYDVSKEILVPAGKNDSIQYVPQMNMITNADFMYQKIE